MTLLERVRKICLALPGAYEKVAWNAPTFRVGERVFAMFADDHHGVGFAGLWLAMPEGAQEELVASAPAHFYVPPYVGKGGWVGIRLESGLSRNVIAGLARDGYAYVASRQSSKRIATKGERTAVAKKPARARPRKRSLRR